MNECKFCGQGTENEKYCSISCQNRDQNTQKANNLFGEFKYFDVVCHKCGKIFKVREREKKFPIKEKYYCSRSCANARVHSEETKNKTRNSLLGRGHKDVIKNCECCGKEFVVKYKKRNRRFCSRSCSSKATMKGDRARKMGLASMKVQSESRRSKNEIYFSELCKGKFNNVKTNESIFNGWDADVILEDFKVAVLWNGNWHHKKIKKSLSVKAVQNRDKIKIGEIIKCGYKPYVIDDFGKYNQKFVENKFQEFLVFMQPFFVFNV